MDKSANHRGTDTERRAGYELLEEMQRAGTIAVIHKASACDHIVRSFASWPEECRTDGCNHGNCEQAAEDEAAREAAEEREHDRLEDAWRDE